jgi:hypothetical protein
MSFARGGRPGQNRSPSHPLLTPRCPPKRTLRALQHLNADAAPVSALDRRRWNGDRPRASPHNATRSLVRWQPLRRGGGGHPVSGPQFPLGLRGAAMEYAASVSTDVAARRGRPSRHVPKARNLTATTNDESYHGSTSELPPANSHGYAEWDFSGVPDPVMFQWFLDAANYWFGYSDNSSTGSYNPACECFVVVVDDQANSANAGAGDGEAPQGPETGPLQGAGPSASPPRQRGCRHQRAASPSARARGQNCGGVSRGATASRLHHRRSLRARRTRA